MPTLIATTLEDIVDPSDGLLSLCETLELANDDDADVITFAVSGVIELTRGALLVRWDTTIPGGGDVTIDAKGASHALLVKGFTTDVVMEDLTITGSASPAPSVEVARSRGVFRRTISGWRCGACSGDALMSDFRVLAAALGFWAAAATAAQAATVPFGFTGAVQTGTIAESGLYLVTVDEARLATGAH